MDYLGAIKSLFGTTELGVLIVFLFGYLILKRITTKMQFGQFHEIDKLIFATTIGTLSYFVLRDWLLNNIFTFFNIIFYLNNSVNEIEYMAMMLTIFLFTVCSVLLLLGEIKTIINRDKIKNLEEPLETLLFISVLISIFAIILFIASYVTILRIITSKILLLSLGIILFALILFSIYTIINPSIKYEKIKKNKKTVICLIIGILAILSTIFFLFPSIEYGQEKIIFYGYDNQRSPRLDNNGFKDKIS